MKELTDNPNIIVFIDELHTLVGAGSAEGSLDAFQGDDAVRTGARPSIA